MLWRVLQSLGVRYLQLWGQWFITRFGAVMCSLISCRSVDAFSVSVSACEGTVQVEEAFEHGMTCVVQVKTYSDWVIDGDYDWPPKCGLCQEVLQETDDVTRLGCFRKSFSLMVSVWPSDADALIILWAWVGFRTSLPGSVNIDVVDDEGQVSNLCFNGWSPAKFSTCRRS